MSVSLTRRLLSVATAGALLPIVAVGTASAATTRGAIAVHTTSKHTVAIAAHAVPGLVAFHNTGSAAVYIARSRGKAGKATFVKDLNATSATGMVRDFDTVAALDGARTIYATLAKGTYYVAAEVVGAVKSANVGTMTVSGTTSNAKAPASTPVSIDSRSRLTVASSALRSRYLRLANHASIELVFLFHVKKGTTSKQSADLVAHPTQKKLSALVDDAAEAAFVGGARTVYADVKAKAGSYFLVAYSAAGNTVNPTFVAGQVRAITLK